MFRRVYESSIKRGKAVRQVQDDTFFMERALSDVRVSDIMGHP